jgi:hypothetical protein
MKRKESKWNSLPFYWLTNVFVSFYFVADATEWDKRYPWQYIVF